jgi:hypothetical protein
MPDLVPWLIGLAMLGLIVVAYATGRLGPAPSKPRRKAEAPTFCAWCIHRAGDDCTHPGSPVSGQPCGPVCIGRVVCTVREARRR